MKKIILLTLLLLLTSTLTGCAVLAWILPTDPQIPYEGKHPELYTVAAYSMPDTQSFRLNIEIIDTDEYGRVLFSCDLRQVYYEGWSGLREPMEDGPVNPVVSYLVFQMMEGDDVYYYDTICAHPFFRDEGITQEETDALKQRNDWGKPLDRERMTFRPSTKGDYTNIAEAWRNYESLSCYFDTLKKFSTLMQISEGRCEVYAFDHDGYGKVLQVLVVDYASKDAKTYFVISDTNGNIEGMNAVMELNDIDYIDDLFKLKQNNGWRLYQ